MAKLDDIAPKNANIYLRHGFASQLEAVTCCVDTKDASLLFMPRMLPIQITIHKLTVKNMDKSWLDKADN